MRGACGCAVCASMKGRAVSDGGRCRGFRQNPKICSNSCLYNGVKWSEEMSFWYYTTNLSHTHTCRELVMVQSSSLYTISHKFRSLNWNVFHGLKTFGSEGVRLNIYQDILMGIRNYFTRWLVRMSLYNMIISCHCFFLIIMFYYNSHQTNSYEIAIL